MNLEPQTKFPEFFVLVDLALENGWKTIDVEKYSGKFLQVYKRFDRKTITKGKIKLEDGIVKPLNFVVESSFDSDFVILNLTYIQLNNGHWEIRVDISSTRLTMVLFMETSEE